MAKWINKNYKLNEMDYIGKSTYSTSIVTYKRREIMREYNILKNENYKNSHI